MEELPHQKGSPLQKRIRAFGYALRGIAVLFASGVHVWVHAIAAILAVALGFWLKISPTEWCCVIFAITTVIACEAFNTAVEYLVDLASPEYHPLAGKAKDVAASAVLISAIGAAAVGVIIFWPKLHATIS